MAAKFQGKPVKSLLDNFPLLLPQDSEKRTYNGYITVLRKNYRFLIEVPDSGNLKDSRIECGWKLRHILRGYQNIIKQRLAQSPDLITFLDELKNLVEKLIGCSSDQNVPVAPPKFYSQLVDEIDNIGWNNLVYIDPSFTVVKLATRDMKNREHILTLQLSSQYPSVAPNCTADLPVPFHFRWSQGCSLKSIHEQFSQVLDNYGDFWDMLDEIDKNTWVLEPDHPSRSSKTRRIALGNSASIQIEVNPQQPQTLPECCFLGADNVTSPLREKLGSNIHLWSMKQSILMNLQAVLECTFPSPQTTKKEEEVFVETQRISTHRYHDFSIECGICYSYKLEGTIPDKACDDSRCGQPFHNSCLYEWLRALPSSRQSFNMIFGECPYCSKPITVKMSGKL